MDINYGIELQSNNNYIPIIIVIVINIIMTIMTMNDLNENIFIFIK